MPNNNNNGRFQNIFGKLKNQIVGTKTSDIDQKLDSAIKDITSYRTHTDQQNYIEVIRNLISKSQGGDLGSNSGLFTQHGDSSPAALGQGHRLKRYKLYESIVSNITYCKRALNVLVENILAPDDITKVSLEITPKSYIEDEVNTESEIKRLRHIISQVKLEESLDIICNNTLKYGDYFCEIADNKTAMTSRSFLVESELLRDTQSDQSNKSVAYNSQDFTININYESLYEKEKNGKKKKEENQDEYNVNELSLVLHEPNRVVKLQSDLYPICFGYLIFPRYAGQGAMGGYFQQQPIDDICAGILKDLQKNIPQASELEKDDELKEIISSMVSNSRSQVMNIRYVPPNRMTHFNVPSTKFYPYGESIFDAVQFDCKVLMAMQTAIAVQRINKSTEKRKIGIELGLPRDATNQIQELKETFRKRKVNLDSFETVDTISCLDLNTKIPMANGFTMKLGEIIDHYQNGNDNMYVYSYDFDTGKVFPNRITSAQISGRNAKVYKVILDNNEEVICTPEHRWLMRDGNYKEAKDLEPDDSLMSNELENNVKVLKLVFLDYGIDVGDIQVKKHHNFGLESGVFVHNSAINTFEDIYVPQRDGRPYVDIENVDAGTTDVKSKVDELEFIRGSIISGLSVPSAFLSLEDTSYRTTLSEENVLFARTVVNHQKYLSEQIRNLLYKLYYLVDSENALTIFDNVDINLPSPRNMQFERQSKAMQDAVNLIESLERVDVPKEWAKKNFLPSLDWNEIENYEIDEKIDKKLGTEDEEEGEGGGGGMGF